MNPARPGPGSGAAARTPECAFTNSLAWRVQTWLPRSERAQKSHQRVPNRFQAAVASGACLRHCHAIFADLFVGRCRRASSVRFAWLFNRSHGIVPVLVLHTAVKAWS